MFFNTVKILIIKRKLSFDVSGFILGGESQYLSKENLLKN